MVCITTDAGSDIHTCRNLSRQVVADDLTAFQLDGDCFAHQGDLMDRGLLYAVQETLAPAFASLDESFGGGEYRYCSDVATLIHLVRDNAADLFTACVAKFGPVGAFARKIH